MMRGSDYHAYKLDQLGFVGRGRSRHRPRNDSSLYGGPYPFFQTGDIGRGIRVRPGIDGAAGQGLRIATINVDLVYGYLDPRIRYSR